MLIIFALGARPAQVLAESANNASDTKSPANSDKQSSALTHKSSSQNLSPRESAYLNALLPVVQKNAYVTLRRKPELGGGVVKQQVYNPNTLDQAYLAYKRAVLAYTAKNYDSTIASDSTLPRERLYLLDDAKGARAGLVLIIGLKETQRLEQELLPEAVKVISDREQFLKSEKNGSSDSVTPSPDPK